MANMLPMNQQFPGLHRSTTAYGNPAPLYTQPQPTFPQYPQAQPQTQPPGPSTLKGRMISDENEIGPNEVAMDGTVSFFPKNDWSCILAKVWYNGSVYTYKFVPEQVSEPAPQEENVENQELKEINKKCDDILKQLNNRGKQYTGKSSYTNKKEQTNER